MQPVENGFAAHGEAVLGRIRARLAEWRGGRPNAELLAALRGEFRALAGGAAAAGYDDISALGGSVESLLARRHAAGGDPSGADEVGLLNLLEEIHDGVAADLGLAPAASPVTSKGHAKSLNSMVALLLPDAARIESGAESGATPGPPGAANARPADSHPPDARLCSMDEYLPRLRRVVEQAAGRDNPPAELFLTGGALELDRQVMDSMLAPLERMVRNSVEHGIEPAGEREAAGKGAAGRIDIGVTRRDAGVLLEYADDGRGLGRDGPAAAAVKMGMTGCADAVGEEHLLQIITQPGYHEAAMTGAMTGAESGGEAAGPQSRQHTGGMERVYRAVRGLGGAMAMSSEAGRGVRFQFLLPSNLLASRALLVRVGGCRFAIRARMIERLLRVRAEEVEMLDGRRCIGVDGRKIPVIDLAAQLAVDKSRVRGAAHSGVLVLLLRLAERMVAFEVDGFGDLVRIVSKNPGAQLASIRGIAGVAALAGADAVLILDPGAFVDRLTLESDGLNRFPLDGAESAQPAGTPAADDAPASPPVPVLALETKLGPVLIPVALVAAVVGKVEPRPSAGGPGWLCGHFQWRSFHVPLIDAAAALGIEREARPAERAVILRPVKGGGANGYFALTGGGRPEVLEVGEHAAALPPPPGARPGHLLGCVRLERGMGLIPDLPGLAREVRRIA